MKDIFFYLRMLMFAFMAVVAASCSDSDDKDAKPTFPAIQKMELNVGDEKTLSFDASQKWSISSSALWCTFVVDGEKLYSVSGGAGRQTVTVRITNDASAVLKIYRADLTLTMGGDKAVIFEISRPSSNYELHVYDSSGSEELSAQNPYLQDYESTGSFVVSANTDWVMKGPDQLDLTETSTWGLAGDVVTVTPTLKKGLENRKDAWEGELKFQDRKGNILFSVPVHYDGLPTDKIELETDNAMGDIVAFSWDGYSFIHKEEEGWAPFELNVAARNDQYRVVYVNYEQVQDDETWEYEFWCDVMSEDDSWFFADDNGKGGLTVYATSNPGVMRSGWLMVFPEAVYESVADDFDQLVLSEKEGITDGFVQYVAASFTQNANPANASGFKITDGNGESLYDDNGEEIKLNFYGDGTGMTNEELENEYGTANVYMLALPLGIAYESIIAEPNGFTGYYLNAESQVVWDGVTTEFYSMTETAIYGIGETTTGDEPMQISFVDPEAGSPFAVLLISRY